MIALSNLINESSKLYDNFEQTLYLSKNYQNILDSIEKLNKDLKNYDNEYLNDLDKNLNENERKEIKESLNNLIIKIQKMNGFAEAKASLDSKFNNFRK